MVNKNSNLHRAKKERDDEFYTTYETIEKELTHYISQFKGKTVLCNCDNPFVSNFCKFFLRNFNILGLKRLICTSYMSFNSMQTSVFDVEPIHKFGCVLDVKKISADFLSDDSISDFLIFSVKPLKGSGDFRSSECLKYLRQSDIVVTNPPFSLFKEMVSVILRHKKQFLLIGNQNALTYKEIFPLIKNNIIWTGYQFGEMQFKVPANSEPRSTRYWVDDTGQKWRSLGNAMWLTNLDNEKRHKNLKLTQKFNPLIHPRYDNYNAIHVRNITEIPFDYNGIMGVPITIINRYNSEQFEIVGEANHGSDNKYDIFKPILHGREVFKRILIRNKAYEQ